MAVVKVGGAQLFDMRSPQIFSGTATLATSTQVAIVSGSQAGYYAGQGFTYSASGAFTGGTITGYYTTNSGRTVSR